MKARTDGVVANPIAARKCRDIYWLGLMAALVTPPVLAVDSAPFEQWLESRHTQLGLKSVDFDRYPVADYFSQSVTMKFKEKLGPDDALARFENLVKEYCTSTGVSWVRVKRDAHACASKGQDMFLAFDLNDHEIDLVGGILGGMKSADGRSSMADLRKTQRRAAKHRFDFLEAKAGQWASPEFRLALNRKGRVSDAESRRTEEIQTANRAIQDADKRRVAEATAARLSAERPKKILVGARICNSHAGYNWVGYTEAYSHETSKIQVRVAGTTDRFTPGGWQPQIIWDNPDNWALCE
jgi:hypothetical protein